MIRAGKVPPSSAKTRDASSDAGRQCDAKVNTSPVVVLLTAVVVGLAFGSALRLAGVHEPGAIRRQMQFRSFIMLKMFLTAAGRLWSCPPLSSPAGRGRCSVLCELLVSVVAMFIDMSASCVASMRCLHQTRPRHSALFRFRFLRHLHSGHGCPAVLVSHPTSPVGSLKTLLCGLAD